MLVLLHSVSYRHMSDTVFVLFVCMFCLTGNKTVGEIKDMLWDTMK